MDAVMALTSEKEKTEQLERRVKVLEDEVRGLFILTPVMRFGFHSS